MSFLFGPISGALLAGGGYYGFSSLIRTRTEQLRKDLYHLSASLTAPPTEEYVPSVSPRLIAPHTMVSAVKTQWNREIENLFVGAREWDRRVGEYGRKVLYGDPSKRPASGPKV